MDLDPAAVEAAATAVAEQALADFYMSDAIDFDGEARAVIKAVWPFIARAIAGAIADQIGAVVGELINLPSDMGEPIADRKLKIAGLEISAGIARSFGSRVLAAETEGQQQ